MQGHGSGVPVFSVLNGIGLGLPSLSSASCLEITGIFKKEMHGFHVSSTKAHSPPSRRQHLAPRLHIPAAPPQGNATSALGYGAGPGLLPVAALHPAGPQVTRTAPGRQPGTLLS